MHQSDIFGRNRPWHNHTHIFTDWHAQPSRTWPEIQHTHTHTHTHTKLSQHGCCHAGHQNRVGSRAAHVRRSASSGCLVTSNIRLMSVQHIASEPALLSQNSTSFRCSASHDRNIYMYIYVYVYIYAFICRVHVAILLWFEEAGKELESSGMPDVLDVCWKTWHPGWRNSPREPSCLWYTNVHNLYIFMHMYACLSTHTHTHAHCECVLAS